MYMYMVYMVEASSLSHRPGLYLSNPFRSEESREQGLGVVSELGHGEQNEQGEDSRQSKEMWTADRARKGKTGKKCRGNEAQASDASHAWDWFVSVNKINNGVDMTVVEESCRQNCEGVDLLTKAKASFWLYSWIS